MTWSTVKDGIAALFASITGLPISNVQWRNKKRNAVVPVRPGELPGAQLLLHVSRSRNVHSEYVFNDDGTETAGEQTELMLEVQCRSYTQDDNVHAVAILEHLRAMIKAPHNATTMLGLELAIKDMGDVIDLSEAVGAEDNRIFSGAAWDIELNAAFNYTSPVQAGTITSVDVSGEVGSDLEGLSTTVHVRAFDNGFNSGFAKQVING